MMVCRKYHFVDVDCVNLRSSNCSRPYVTRCW